LIAIVFDNKENRREAANYHTYTREDFNLIQSRADHGLHLQHKEAVDYEERE
jgi:hypothetical protein